MSGSYFRRSRTGCVSFSIKCDEDQPACGRCEERGVHCGGYSVRLQWMDQSINDPSKKQPSQSSRQKSKHVTVSLPPGRQISSNSSRSLASSQRGTPWTRESVQSSRIRLLPVPLHY